MRSSAPMPGAPTLIVPRDLDPLGAAGRATRQSNVVQMLACRAFLVSTLLGKRAAARTLWLLNPFDSGGAASRFAPVAQGYIGCRSRARSSAARATSRGVPASSGTTRAPMGSLGTVPKFAPANAGVTVSAGVARGRHHSHRSRAHRGQASRGAGSQPGLRCGPASELCP